MQDKSASMDCPVSNDVCPDDSNGAAPMPLVHPTRWEATTLALDTFVVSPQSSGVGIGIGFFTVPGSNATACDVMSYATPTVPIAPLPGNSQAFVAAVATWLKMLATPEAP